MGGSSRLAKAWAQGVFYAAILALLISRAVSSNISHDENQFIAPGQFLAYDGLLPYVNYPYTHMPYAIPFYALSAALFDYDLLAGRLLSVFFWLGSILLMVAVGRSLNERRGQPAEPPSWRWLLWEFVVVLAFVHDATSEFVLRAALNHSLAAFFSLLAMLVFVRGAKNPVEPRLAAFWSGVCIAVAGLTRFNYASLVVVVLAGWLGMGLMRRPRAWRSLGSRFIAGALLASVPAMLLAVLAPRQFYYGNLAYIRLNTVYYEVILHRTGMDMASKLIGFASVLMAEPIQLLLYAVLLFTIISSLLKWRQDGVSLNIPRLTIAAAAITMLLTAFAPTPALLQYLAAPLPFLLILLQAFEIRLPRFETAARTLGATVVAAVVLSSTIRQGPLADLRRLGRPEEWPPVQVHELATNIRALVPDGRVLGLQSMVPMEAGLDAYPFTATGPFSWRTSQLLTAQRRADYEVVSPEELRDLLEAQPPQAVLVGFEGPNPGFERNDMGGLERPFSEFAVKNGYTAIRLVPPFWPRGLMLWIRP